MPPSTRPRSPPEGAVSDDQGAVAYRPAAEQRRVPSGPRIGGHRVNSHGTPSAVPENPAHDVTAGGSAAAERSPRPERILEPAHGRTSPVQLTSPNEPPGRTASPSKAYQSVRSSETDLPAVISPRSRVSKLSLNTTNLLAPRAPSPQKATSPSLLHWQQLRSHVVASPVDQRPSSMRDDKRLSGLVHKTVGRLGFRQAAENVMGLDQRRQSMAVFLDQPSGLSAEEKEEIIRERRRFARDIKQCLDACAQEDSRRRMQRATTTGQNSARSPPSASQSSYTFHPDFSAFAPLLTELHKYLPAARARKVWCRTCPHHSAILAELATAFLPDSSTTEGERQQVLEMFGVIVRNWTAEGPEDVVERWLWLCTALRVPERQLRARGIKLLTGLMHADPAYSALPDVPDDAHAYLAIAMALVRLLYAFDTNRYETMAEFDQVMKLFTDLVQGGIMDVRPVSLVSLTGKELQGSTDGVVKELAWLAVGRCLAIESGLAAWLLKPDNPLIMRVVPPPLLHATPQVILDMRHLSTLNFLNSISDILAHLDDEDVLQAWQALQDLVMPNAAALPDSTDLHRARLDLLIGVIVRTCNPPRRAATLSDDDPFAGPSLLAGIRKGVHTELLAALASDNAQTALMHERWRIAVRQRAESAVIAVIRTELVGPSKLLANAGIEAFIERIATFPLSADAIAFLAHLRTAHPPIFYKPLFSLAACTSSATLPDRLRKVHCLTQAVGRQAFWLEADPQMVSIVLSGGQKAGFTPVTAATPIEPQNDADCRGGEEALEIEVGKYAVMAEFLLALAEVEKPVERGSASRGFLDKVESKIASNLMQQEEARQIPLVYRLLIITFFTSVRRLTRSARRSAWMDMLLKWLLDTASAHDDQSTQLGELVAAYKAVSQGNDAPPALASLLGLRPDSVSLRALVMLHPCWTPPEWASLAEMAWNLMRRESDGTDGDIRQHSIFLITKASEIIPDHLAVIIRQDLTSAIPATRLSAVHKLNTIYAHRYQLGDIESIADPSKPSFHFPSVTTTAAPTEIGSATWVPPADLQDAALNQFGKTLPLDVRRRLLDLGWSDDPTLKTAGDERYQVPISDVPLSFLDEARDRAKQQTLKLDDKDGKGHKGTHGRKLSTSSNGSDRHLGRRRAVVPPIISDLLFEHASDLLKDDAAGISGATADMIHAIQREDASALLRPFFSKLDTPHLATALSQLSSVIGPHCTPSFAYTAMNAIVGHLRHTLRQERQGRSYIHHAACLAIVAKLIPHVPAISLREIRKNRAEQALLPGTVYEDGTGFRFFPSWDPATADVGVQTAQLDILLQLLIANPRDAYLIKRILVNLNVDESISDIQFARAWNTVLVQLFSIIQRIYNDRSELEHFLQITARCIAAHADNLTVVAGSMRLLMLCSARFRRLFAAVGMSACGRSMFHAYTHGNTAVRDAVFYALRSIYRIHSDTSVYQFVTCLADTLVSTSTDPSEDIDAAALHDLLSCLSTPDGPSSGVASGLRGLNDKEELATQVQMLSGPELALSDIGKDRAERQASKIAAIVAGSADKLVFPLPNIVRLFFTAIAVNPPAHRAVALLGILARMIRSVRDIESKGLVEEGVEALGRLMRDKQVDTEAANAAYGGPTPGPGGNDWQAARQAYLDLVSAFLQTGGQVGGQDMKVVLGILDDVARHPMADTGVGNAFVDAYAEHHLMSTTILPKPQVQALHDLAPIFARHVANLDWTKLLLALARMVGQPQHRSDVSLLQYIESAYIGPAMQYVANPSTSIKTGFGPALVKLVTCCIAAQGDTLRQLEDLPATASLLLTFVGPFVGSFELDRINNASEANVWIRLLDWTVRSALPPKTYDETTSAERAAMFILGLQVIKVIMIRGGDALSGVAGLWSYISSRLVMLFADLSLRSPIRQEDDVAFTTIEWAMWTVYEFAVMYRSPLLIDLRPYILEAIQSMPVAQTHDNVFDRSLSSQILVDPPSPLPPDSSESARPRLSPRAPSYGSRRRSRYGSASPDHSFDRSFPFLQPGSTEGVSPGQSPLSSPVPPAGSPTPRLSLAPRATPIIDTARRSSAAIGVRSSPRGRDTAARVKIDDTPGVADGPAGGERTAPPSPSPSPSPSPRPPNVGRLIAPGIRNRFPSSAPLRNVYMASTDADSEAASTGLGIFGNTRPFKGRIKPDEKGRTAGDTRKGGAIVHLLGAPTQMLVAPGMPTHTTGSTNPSGGREGDYARYRMKQEAVKRRTELARRRVELVMGVGTDVAHQEYEEVDTRQWNDAGALDEIERQTDILRDEFSFVLGFNDDNDTHEKSDASVVVDTSRLSAMYDKDDKVGVDKLGGVWAAKQGYLVGEDDHPSESLPFLPSPSGNSR